jgi:hypothetical protein
MSVRRLKSHKCSSQLSAYIGQRSGFPVCCTLFLSTVSISLRILLLFGLAILHLCIGSAAYAGFVDFECQTNHPWSFDYASAKLNLRENIEVINYDKVIMSSETKCNPIFHITKTVDNNSVETWTAYELTLSGPDAHSDYAYEPNTSGARFLHTDKEAMKLTFYEPNLVPPRDMVTSDFDINAPIGLFGSTLTQHPMLEPASATILVVGIFFIASKRKQYCDWRNK